MNSIQRRLLILCAIVFALVIVAVSFIIFFCFFLCYCAISPAKIQQFRRPVDFGILNVLCRVQSNVGVPHPLHPPNTLLHTRLLPFPDQKILHFFARVFSVREAFPRRITSIHSALQRHESVFKTLTSFFGRSEAVWQVSEGYKIKKYIVNGRY